MINHIYIILYVLSLLFDLIKVTFACIISTRHFFFESTRGIIKMINQCKSSLTRTLRKYTQLHLTVIEEYRTPRAVSIMLLIMQLTQQWIFLLRINSPFYTFIRLPITWNINQLSQDIYSLQLQYVMFSILIFKKILISNLDTQPCILKYSPISALYQEIIWIPSITFMFLQSYYNMVNQNYIHLIFCVIFDLLLIGNTILHLYIFGDCLTLNTRSIRKLQNTKEDFLILALNILQALLFSNILQMENHDQLQASILIIIQLIGLYRQQLFTNYVRIKLIYTNIIFSNINLLLGIVLFYEVRYSFTILVILLPIIIFVQIHRLSSYIQHICINQNLYASHLVNKLVLMINNQFNLNNVQKAIIFTTHQQNCMTVSCFCQNINDYQTLFNSQGSSQQSQYLQFVQKIKIKINFTQYQLSTLEITKLRDLMEQKKVKLLQLVGILINFGYQIEALNLINEYENHKDKSRNIIMNEHHLQQKLIFLKNYLRKDLVRTILLNSGQTLEVDIKSYCANQNKKTVIYDKIQQHLLRRIKFFEYLHTQRVIYNYNIESYLYLLGVEIQEVYQQLLSDYKCLPNQQNLVILQFFQSQIMSNMAMVAKSLNLPIIRTDQLYNHIYMVFEMQSNQDLKIISKSKNYTELIAKADNLNDLLPTFIQDAHQYLLFNFMKTGKSKFFQKFNKNYIKINQYEMKPIEFYVEILEQPILKINQDQSDGIQFVVFMNETNESILSFATNIQHQVCCYSSDLITKLKQDKYNFSKLLSIDLIIPSFKSICQIFETQESITLYDEILIFKSKKRQYQYKADINIQSRIVKEHCYYIVQITKFELQQYFDQPEQSTDETKTNLFVPQINYKNHSTKLAFCQTISTNRDLITQRNNSTEQPLIYAQEFETPQQLNSPNNELRDPILEIIPHISEQEFSGQSSVQTKVNYNIEDMKPYQKSVQNERLINTKQPICITKSIIVSVVSFIIFIIYGILVLISVNPDLQVFVSEIDMIGLHASFMGPYDLFFSQRVSITNYQNYQKAGILTMAQFQIIYQPLLANVVNDFNECFVSEYAVLESKALRTFFIDESLTAYFMKYNSTQVYSIEMGFKEVLIILITNLVNYRLVYLAGGSTIGTPYYTFQYANYINIHEKFENLTVEIQKYSINRAYNISSKQISIWVIFLSISLLCISYLAYMHFKFDKINKKFIQFLSHMHFTDIESELKRLRNIYQLIKKTDIITYRFDPKSINKQRYTESNTTTKSQKKQQLSILNSNKFLIRNIITQVSIYSFIIIFSIIVNAIAQSYIMGYIETVPFYKLVQDLKFRSGMGYLYREIYLRWSNFPYLTQNDRIRLDNLYYNSIQVQEQYLDLSGINILILGGFNSSQILFSDEFIQFWEQTRSQPLCQFVPNLYMGFLYRYCNMSLDGTLKGGLVSALTFAINDLETQRAINNFTTRVDYELYEQEGVQIITRVFFEMSDILKEGMQAITSHYINVIKIITILFLLICLAAIYYTISIRYYRLQLKHDILKQSMFVLPQNTIYHSDSLERDVIRLYYQLSKS